MSDDAAILLNGAFRPQRVTGQQRYASELASELKAMRGVRELQPPSGSKPLRSWLWAQTIGARLRSEERLLTLTSRGPVVAPRQVVVVHDLFVIEHPEWYSPQYVRSHQPLLRAQLRYSEAIIAVSEPVAQRVREIVGYSKPVVTAPNAPSAAFLPVGTRQDDHAVLMKYGLASNGYVLGVGSADPRKNVDRLIAAHRTLERGLRAQFPIVLAGGGSSIFRDTDTHTPDEVIRLGYISDADLAVLYRHSALVAFPSLDEGFGLPVVEALASGARVLASDIPVVRWVAGDHPIYVDPLDVESIAHGLSSALGIHSVSNRSMASGSIRDRFSWVESARVVYELVAGLHDGQAPATVKLPPPEDLKGM